MLNWLKALDRVLRGEATSVAALRNNELDVPVWGLCVLIDAMGLIYGLCMGVFDLATGKSEAWKQTIACMFKVPALFLLTLAVTTPSLYVFNAIVGSRLTLRSVLRLLVASLAVMLAVLASIGPIVAFFSFTTTSYSFMILLNVVVFAIAGSLGTTFLLQSLHRLAIYQIVLIPEVEETIGPLERTANQVISRSVRRMFQIWVVVFGLVGGQMAWVLRPFLGNPSERFTFFRPVGSNFFQAVWNNLNHLTH